MQSQRMRAVYVASTLKYCYGYRISIAFKFQKSGREGNYPTVSCCWAYAMLQHKIMEAYCLQPDELSKVQLTNLLRFARDSNRYQ